MRKLLQLNVTANWGSTGKIAEGIGISSIQRGWNSYVAYGRMMNPSRSQLIKVGNKFDVYAHYARNRFLDGEGLGSSSATKVLVRKIDEISPDIIHLHNIHDHWLNYPTLFNYLSKIETPVVWTFHDCWAFTGGCPYFEEPTCDKWKFHCEHCPLRSGKIDLSKLQFENRKSLIASLGKRLTIVPVSQWLENYCSESILANCNIRLIHNGIDTSQFKLMQPKNIKPLILGVALVWDYRKGLDDFIKLRKLIPLNVADITLVGLSCKQISKLPEGIKGIERTQSLEELVKLYNQAAVLVNPTYADNFPTVNLEAMACGTPVITYRTGGSPEAVDENTGIVVEKGDINALAAAVKTVIDNPARFNPEACRLRAVTHFNKEIQFNKYIDLYETLLSH